MSLILESIKSALLEGSATVNLKEASALTGSGSDVGGRVIYDDAFASMREHNPLRDGSRIIQTIGSDQAFVVKTGNATLIENGSNNPWGYPVNNNTGSPNIATSFWQLPVRSINAGVPIRSAVMSDINGIEEAIASDLMLEFSQQESLSMMFNDDQAAFGTSGSAMTNGLHTILEVQQTAHQQVAYDDLANLQAALPSQYLYKETTAWMMHPTTIGELRKLKASGSNNNFIEVGDYEGGAVLYVFGHRVIPNPYMDISGVGKYPVYLAEWSQFFTIADSEMMSIKRFDQTQPGFIYLFAEKRVCSTIRDVFSGVRLVGV